MIVDSGSSDTWIMQEGFTCLNVTAVGHYDYEVQETNESYCNFGSVYNGTFQDGAIADVCISRCGRLSRL